MAKKIRIRHDVDPATVLTVVNRVADDLGYRFDRHDDVSATAHQGGDTVKGRATATRARIGVRYTPGVLRLKSETSGAAYAGAAGVALFAWRINSSYAKFARHTKTALTDASLT